MGTINLARRAFNDLRVSFGKNSSPGHNGFAARAVLALRVPALAARLCLIRSHILKRLTHGALAALAVRKLCAWFPLPVSRLAHSAGLAQLVYRQHRNVAAAHANVDKILLRL